MRSLVRLPFYFLVGAMFLRCVDVYASNRADETEEIMAISKIAGACGILDSLITFQKQTRLEGGDKFVVRFWAVEAARLGVSVEALSELCDVAIETYEQRVQEFK